MKFKVIFEQGDNVVTLVDGLTDIQACQFAINLHQSSNLAHEIRVREYGSNTNDVILTFIKK